MPCSKCSQTGHNVRTCSQVINEEQTVSSDVPTNQEPVDNTESAVVEEVDKCPICLDNINNTDCCTTSCGHKFCLECMVKHRKTKNNCPICRNILNARQRLPNNSALRLGPPPRYGATRYDRTTTRTTSRYGTTTWYGTTTRTTPWYGTTHLWGPRDSGAWKFKDDYN